MLGTHGALGWLLALDRALYSTTGGVEAESELCLCARIKSVVSLELSLLVGSCVAVSTARDGSLGYQGADGEEHLRRR